MKKMQIFEPAMCCSTGLCGVGVDPELLRISTVLDTLKKNGITVERYNLSSAPQQFVNNKVISELLGSKGVEGLPAAVLEGKVVLAGRYPTNAEFSKLLELPAGLLGKTVIPVKVKAAGKKPGDCGCKGGCC
jgi:hypothetical protein